MVVATDIRQSGTVRNRRLRVRLRVVLAVPIGGRERTIALSRGSGEDFFDRVRI